jgi:dipeptidyl-peptidase-4
MLLRSLPIAVTFFICSTALGYAQQPGRTLTTDDYAHAERWMNYNTGSLVLHTVGGVQYLPDGRVFYRDPGANGVVYVIADPARGTKVPAFDNAKLAAALNSVSKRKIDAKSLGITSYTPDASGFMVGVRGGYFHCDADANHCEKMPSDPRPAQPQQQPNAQPPAGQTATEVGGNAQMNAQSSEAAPPAKPAGRNRTPFDVSPDKRYAAFIRDYNLWVRVRATGEEKQLTTDGVKDFGYATDNAGWTHSDAPIVLWSPDSKKIATFQQDQRKTGELYLVPVTNRHPKLEAWKYPLVGDADVTTIQRVVIDVDGGKVTRLKMPPDQHRSTLCDDVSCRGGSGWDDVDFSTDGKHIAFVSTSRDHKDEWLRVADTETGEVREVFHEHAPHFFESGNGAVNWRYLPDSNEFLWFSERDNWGQLYLYDLTTGKLKNQITHGDGNVTELLRVDERNRVLYFLAVGKEKDRDPYFTQYYRIGFDGKNMQLLTPENADHAITPSYDASTFVDVYSTNETPQTAVVRDNTAKVLLQLAKQDISQLTAAGWKPPVPITVKGRDGKTPLYGFMWKPTSFDASKKYPLVDYVYPGPQEGSCPARTFKTSTRDNQALADLGFIVICIDGMGTPFRSKAFHEFYSTPEMLGDDTIPDQVSGIKDLASRSPWIDLDRVGVWGHSGGGNATASAMFHFPDFFKVGIAESGNHDSRLYEDDWDEKWGGLEKIGPDGKSNYDAQANQNWAKNLKGHLLLAHGTMDDNVPPNNTLLVVDALIKANKDFDLLMIPNAHHGYAEASQYMMRRRWDYFVRYLAGDIPPLNYQMRPYSETERLNDANGPSDDEVDEQF